jgi:two-component system nitrate/nitrite response regulator NarL
LRDPGEGLLRPDVDVFVLVAVRLYRDGIADALARDPRFRVVGDAGALEDAREQLRRLARPPDVALVDLGLPEGAGATRALRVGWPALNIVALAVPEADEEIVQLAEAGVAGLVTREAGLAEVLDAVAAAARREVLTSPSVTAVLLRRVTSLAGERRIVESSALTRREREIVHLIGRGLSNKEIAHSLSIELSTVKNHVHNILEKLQVHRRAEAVSAARERGGLDEI